MSEPQLVCLGAGSEYVLEPLASEARRRGLRVFEIDMYEPGWRAKAAACIERPFVLVTSHHPYLDGWAHQEAFKVAADLDAVATFVRRERPERAFFVPHDLSEHLHPEELYSLYLFDALLMPDERYWFLRSHVRVEPVGWIKAAAGAGVPDVPLTLMPSEVAYYSRNPDLFAARFAPVLARAPRFKLARFAGAERLEEIARETGCEIMPPEVASNSLIQATFAVVSNALSSIIMEASAAGQPTLCLLDGLHPAAEQRRVFGDVPGVTLRSPEESGEWLDHVLAAAATSERPNAALPPFDFDRTLAIVFGRA